MNSSGGHRLASSQASLAREAQLETEALNRRSA